MPEGPRSALAYGVLARAALRRAERAAPAEAGDAAEADIRTAPWWRVATLRRSAAHAAISVGGLLALAFVTVNAYPWWADAAALSGGDTATAKAAVREVDGVLVPVLLPDNLMVDFRTADGRLVRTHIAHGRGEPPAPGDTLTVRYAVGSPEHAAAAGGHGLLWGVVDSLVLAALCLARIGWCAVGATRTTRALVAAARSPEAHPVRYVRLHDCDDGSAWLLFFPLPGGDADRPGHLLPVRNAAGDPVGTADLRGDVRHGGVTVPWIDGRAVWPSGGLGVFGPGDEEFVLHLATGTLDRGDPGDRRKPVV